MGGIMTKWEKFKKLMTKEIKISYFENFDPAKIENPKNRWEKILKILFTELPIPGLERANGRSSLFDSSSSHYDSGSSFHRSDDRTTNSATGLSCHGGYDSGGNLSGTSGVSHSYSDPFRSY